MPYTSPISVQHFLSYPTHSTGCPLCDAVAEVMTDPTVKDPKSLAKLMGLDRRKLSSAIEIQTGLPLQQLMYQVRYARIKQFILEHPAMHLRDVARHFGYSCYRGLWVFLNMMG